jgi:hypothetical protein
MPTGTANLASLTGETIRIDFSAQYSPPSGDSSAWSIRARNVHFTLTVPQDRSMPTLFIAQLFPGAGGNPQAVILQNTAAGVYCGTAPNDFIIRSGNMGMSQDYTQTHEFTPQCAGSLIDPMNGTPRFQTNLFFATPFATTDPGLWHTL